jgi:hypothetical protein
MKTLAQLCICAICKNLGFFKNGELESSKETPILPSELIEKINNALNPPKIVYSLDDTSSPEWFNC